MLANAVSSAVERLYAAAPVGDDRVQVPRVSAVSAITRLKVVGQDDASREAEVLEERDRVQHRQALTRGVLAVFESTGSHADPLGQESGAATGDATDRQGADPTRPDPQLEEAILRFIHTMFRSLAATDEPTDVATAADATGRAGVNAVSREALSARSEALAHRLADAAAPADAEAAPGDAATGARKVAPSPAAAVSTAGMSDANLQKAFAEVVQALHGKMTQSQTTRAELVSMMQRLAHAMHGTPPIDPGLPTRGGLLSARA